TMKLSNSIEAILFVSGKAVEISFIKEKLEATDKQMNEAIAELKAKYSGDSGIHLLQFNKKLQFASNPDLAKDVEAVLNPIRERELTNAMLETLAIVAYKQPVTRIEIEEIRAVDCTYSVQNLMKLGMIQVVGRKETIGKPLLFATTDEFLKRFSISDVTDLPDYQVLLDKLQDITSNMGNVTTVEKPMFDNVGEVPDFLQGEDVQVIE
ncbi:MAG: SMC-Scp complex subunit ScpB, partial [Clostridia bacterium]|nr:SMC-Scp complex subunit ScpB [Clostridia bacterium]